jgi:hypothetical protein
MCLANLGGAFKALLCLRDIYYSKHIQCFVNLFREFFSRIFLGWKCQAPKGLKKRLKSPPRRAFFIYFLSLELETTLGASRKKIAKKNNPIKQAKIRV